MSHKCKICIDHVHFSVVQWIRELEVANYNWKDCVGKDGANYTFLVEFSVASDGGPVGIFGNGHLVQCNSNGEIAVNSMQALAHSNYPDGGII